MAIDDKDTAAIRPTRPYKKRGKKQPEHLWRKYNAQRPAKIAAKRAKLLAKPEKKPNPVAWKHGLSKTLVYRRWYQIKHRHRKICERWKNVEHFAADIAKLGERPSPLHCLRRIDSKRPWEPGNVHWTLDNPYIKTGWNKR